MCLEDFESGDPVRVLPCQHVYHVVCIDTWLIDKGTCPYCKMDFMTKSFPEEKKSVCGWVWLRVLHERLRGTVADRCASSLCAALLHMTRKLY